MLEFQGGGRAGERIPSLIMVSDRRQRDGSDGPCLRVSDLSCKEFLGQWKSRRAILRGTVSFMLARVAEDGGRKGGGRGEGGKDFVSKSFYALRQPTTVFQAIAIPRY